MILKNKVVNGEGSMVNGEGSMVNGKPSVTRCPLPIARCPLPIAHCPLPVAHCPLPIAHCLLPIAHCLLPITYCLLLIVFLSGCATCKYSFKDVSIPVEVKTFRVNYLENKARYINPQLSPQLTERLKQKIIGSTRLQQTNNDDAHYDIGGYVSDYSVTTAGITNGNASTNRLTVSFHIIFKNTLDEKKNFESDVTSTFDFSSNQNLSQVEAERNEEIVKNIVDAVFNKIFSNW